MTSNLKMFDQFFEHRWQAYGNLNTSKKFDQRAT
jgi:hypothetical protein